MPWALEFSLASLSSNSCQWLDASRYQLEFLVVPLSEADELIGFLGSFLNFLLGLLVLRLQHTNAVAQQLHVGGHSAGVREARVLTGPSSS